MAFISFTTCSSYTYQKSIAELSDRHKIGIWKESIFHAEGEIISFEHTVSLKQGTDCSNQYFVSYFDMWKRFQYSEICHVWINAELQTEQAHGDTSWEVI